MQTAAPVKDRLTRNIAHVAHSILRRVNFQCARCHHARFLDRLSAGKSHLLKLIFHALTSAHEHAAVYIQHMAGDVGSSV